MQSLAVDISLAALLGDKVYSFGELLLHPIVSILTLALSQSWLQSLNSDTQPANMHQYLSKTIKLARLRCTLLLTYLKGSLPTWLGQMNQIMDFHRPARPCDISVFQVTFPESAAV